MRKLVYYVGVSIDGYIAGPANEVEFYPVADELVDWMKTTYPEVLPTPMRPHIGVPSDTPNHRFDTVIMGRGTYQPGLDIGATSPYAHLRQYVVSRSFGKSADPAVEVVDHDPLGLVRRLKSEVGGDIWLAGGGNLAGQLLTEIDELIIKSYPVVAGAGVAAFTDGFRPTAFTPTERKNFADGVQVSWFTRG
ncbi:dihydrofolate reductase family protein [Nocardia callitridis]|uniref:Dihydrofolate reductase family protein n=1 Tax=Nocardia callitridis TaxID=648753 RepID=A0ABP9JYT4_9NOCA